MKIIIDGRALDLYPLGEPGFSGGTEEYVRHLASGLAGIGHKVHVVTSDLDTDEQRGEREWWWGPEAFPTKADAVVMVPSVEKMDPYSAEILIVATNGIGHNLGGNDSSAIDAFPVFSENHADLLVQHQGVDRAKCFVTGLGVSLREYDINAGRDSTGAAAVQFYKIPGRMLVGNDPQRGLWHVLDIFDKLKPLVPHATLHVTYDCQKVFDSMRWQASYMAQQLLDVERRLAATEGVTYLGPVSRQELIREQLECQVHAWPSDPPNIGSQIHGIFQMECAAAGAALVLSSVEALPEVFGEAATLLRVPGAYASEAERRVTAEDWAEVVAELMLDPEKWTEASRKARALAEQHTWSAVIDRWEAMLGVLAGKVAVAA